ncbi:MAG TPA: PHB depolymerase family esterase, partial [Bacteroidota bacterium]|nr:PHB depolymerase family esterase [Bacteroidota bacterium]
MSNRFFHRQLLLALANVFLFTMSMHAQEDTIRVGSALRKMIVYAPPGIQANSPLVLSLHGMNQTMNDQKNQTQFQSVARDNNFVLVFPQSNGTMWDLGGTSDINFILAIIDEMSKRYGIDRDRVYLSGFSMGGMMTYYAATKIADKIAAYAPVSGFLMGGPNTNSSRPIPIIHVHGMDDNFVPYNNVQTCMDAWIARNGCPTTPVVTKPFPADKPASQSSKKYWGPGKEGVEVVFISVAGVGHWYSDDPNAVFTSREIWNFCKRYSLKDG